MVTTMTRKNRIPILDDEDGREATWKEGKRQNLSTNSHTELYERLTCKFFFFCAGQPQVRENLPRNRRTCVFEYEVAS